MNIDETHHKKSSEGEKGGTRSMSLTNPNLPRAGSKYAKDDGNHVSACYGCTPLEALPPVIIYKSTAKDPKNIRIKPSWVKGLPTVMGKWGFDRPTLMDSQVCARSKGSMEEDLFVQTCLSYKALYPNLAPRFKWDKDGKVIEGPVMMKTDSGPGRQSKSERSIKFRADMHALGFHMCPGLCNATSVHQEMDDLYQLYKSRTDQKSQEVFAKKTYDRAMAVHAHKNDPSVKIPVAHLTNDDIPTIINGLPDDPIEKKPHDRTFTKKNMFKSFLKIGWTPLTREALRHPKVRHMLGKGGASADVQAKLKGVQARYDDLKDKVQATGINGFVFNSKIPVHQEKHNATKKTEDEQVRALVDAKKTFSAGAQWATVGMQLLGSRAIIRAQTEQMKKEKKGGQADAAKKLATKKEKLVKADEALALYRSNATMTRVAWDNILKFLWPRFDSKAAPSKMNTIAKIKEKLADLGREKGGKEFDVLLDEELARANAEWTTASAALEISEAADDTHSVTGELVDDGDAGATEEDGQDARV